MTLSLGRFTSITFSHIFSATKTPTPDNPSVLLPVPKNLHFALSLSNHLPFTFHPVSCTHKKSNFLLSIISAISALRPLIVPTFAEPTRRSTHGQGYLTFRYLRAEMYNSTDCSTTLDT